MFAEQRICLRFILKSGQAIVRDFTEREARDILDNWVKGEEKTIGSLLQKDARLLWVIRADSVDFIDVVDVNQVQQQAMQQQPQSQYRGSPMISGGGARPW